MKAQTLERLQQLSHLIRAWILQMTQRAGSGHPTSSLSAVELMTSLLFGDGLFLYDVDNPEHPNNDRLIFSKGHASPLFYCLWADAGQITEEELLEYRRFDSPLEGHPTSRFRFTEAATGSLGQGLSIGVGMALNARHDRLPYRTYVLLGDSEMSEGSQWEAVQLAAHYKLDNLVGVLDVNRLGQRGETMYGHDLEAYRRRMEAFGWAPVVVEDGHDCERVVEAYRAAAQVVGRPVMIIAKTLKGKGVPLVEDEDGWHGKALDQQQLDEALQQLGDIPRDLRGTLVKPEVQLEQPAPANGSPAQTAPPPDYSVGDGIPTRNAYGNALRRLAEQYPRMVVLDGEVANSTRAEYFRDAFPERYYEMFIAEQNMVGTALGLSLRGKMPFVSSLAAFLTRAFDQIRMSCHSAPNLKFVGSHAGVSIGQDGPSQMGLEDLAMFRTLPGAVVLYPCDAMSTERLVEAMADYHGTAYLRTTRGATPVIYEVEDEFPIGGSKVVRSSDADTATVIAAGVTLHEALKAYEHLQSEGTSIRVIDVYSIKPLDEETLRQAAAETGLLITVEDHYAEGGLGEAVCAALAGTATPIRRLAVDHRPRSGPSTRLLDDQGISARAIIDAVSEPIDSRSSVSSIAE